MEENKYTVEQFKALIKEDHTATWETNPLDVSDIIEIGIDGLNEIACDDIVDGGYLLQDISYQFKRVEEGKVVIEVTCQDAAEWEAKYGCPQ